MPLASPFRIWILFYIGIPLKKRPRTAGGAHGRFLFSADIGAFCFFFNVVPLILIGYMMGSVYRRCRVLATGPLLPRSSGLFFFHRSHSSVFRCLSSFPGQRTDYTFGFEGFQQPPAQKGLQRRRKQQTGWIFRRILGLKV